MPSPSPSATAPPARDGRLWCVLCQDLGFDYDEELSDFDAAFARMEAIVDVNASKGKYEKVAL